MAADIRVVLSEIATATRRCIARIGNCLPQCSRCRATLRRCHGLDPWSFTFLATHGAALFGNRYLGTVICCSSERENQRVKPVAFPLVPGAGMNIPDTVSSLQTAAPRFALRSPSLPVRPQTPHFSPLAGGGRTSLGDGVLAARLKCRSGTPPPYARSGSTCSCSSRVPVALLRNV